MKSSIERIPVQGIIAAAGSRTSALTEIGAHGPECVAEIFLAELVSRMSLLDEPEDPAVVQWDLGFADNRIGFVLETGTGTVRAGWAAEPDVVVRQDLPEALQAVFGPAGPHQATREMFVEVPGGRPGLDPGDPLVVRHASAVRAAKLVRDVLSGPRLDLAEIAIRAGADKWGTHWYTDLYERYFGSFRDHPVSVLEIGCDGGESLRMWAHYFSRGVIHRLDTQPGHGGGAPRARIVEGDQGDAASLRTLAERFGPFDIVIDDGTHVSEHVITSFTTLYPHLNPGGLYVIEDIGSSYWPSWGGSSVDLNRPDTSLGFVKTLVDGLNHQQLVRDDPYEPTLTDRTVSGVCLHHNIAFIEKGVNTERGAPAWVSAAGPLAASQAPRRRGGASTC
ncbi:class I SAM-dependent methyltransferase [Streptomyces sp. MUM 2J]|uniref:class I SAM-dependent methyltransferase n=1 Tax=Streptomyces sp. MUM 2J TaxID=2791987 RepID=UPI001F049961|nr:class I SAM-dependent methyltransferase [Streptomyces sp. MUM 2J]MCH0566867.1 class I SAM-dependent methyltransferase [Streptomyces sp. MUM 2J]